MTEKYWEVATPWRAGCGERRMSGSEGGVGKHSLAVRPAPTLHIPSRAVGKVIWTDVHILKS